MRKKRITFTGSRDHELGAQLDMPDDKPRAYAIFAHCFTCTKNLKSIGNITAALAEDGIAVLRFDFTGLGDSKGDFADTNFSSNIADLEAAARFLEEHYEAPKILIGHSLGGTAALHAAGELDTVKAVAVIAAPFGPDHVMRLFTGRESELEEKGEIEVSVGGRPFIIKKQFIDDLKHVSMGKRIRDLKRPIIIFHSPVDKIVRIENAQKIFVAAKHPKSFISLDDADHLLLQEKDSRYVGSVIAAWAERYI